MKLPLIEILLSDATAKAVSWTLVHSLWQGLLAAVLAGIIIGCTRKLPAVLRHKLLAADLLLFLLVAMATFVYEMRQEDRPVNGGAMEVANKGAARVQDGAGGRTGDGLGITSGRAGRSIGGYTGGFGYIATELQRAVDYLNAHAAVVTLIWLACLSGQLLWLTMGLYEVRRLRRNSIAPPGKYWNERLWDLACGLGIKKKVELLQSGWITVPAVVGFLKPCILVPVGMLTHLSPKQVETILLHELAHIDRRDYITNLLLHIAEAIFFFNPGVRWIASLIRQEREACCDDMVLAGVADKDSYFEALVAFKQWVVDGRFAAGRSYALQLGGGKSDLLWRIRRMLDQENKKLQVMEKAILSFGLMALVAVSLISMKGKGGQPATPASLVQFAVSGPAPGISEPPALPQAEPPSEPPAEPPAGKPLSTLPPAIRAKADTVPAPDERRTPGKKITFTNIRSHTDEQNGKLVNDILATDERGNQYKVRTVDGEVNELTVKDKVIAKEEFAKYEDIIEAVIAEKTARSIPAPPVPPVPVTGSIEGSGSNGYGNAESGAYEEAVRRYEEDTRRYVDAARKRAEFESQNGEIMRRYEEDARKNPDAAKRLEEYERQHVETLRRYEEETRRYEEQMRRYEDAARRSGAALRAERPGRPEGFGLSDDGPQRLGLRGPVGPEGPVGLKGPVGPVGPVGAPVRAMGAEPPPTPANPLVFANRPNEYIIRIVADLMENHLIAHVEKFSFTLNAKGLTVNGVRQPDNIFEKFKTRYIQHPRASYDYSQYYTSHGSGSHCEVHTGEND